MIISNLDILVIFILRQRNILKSKGIIQHGKELLYYTKTRIMIRIVQTIQYRLLDTAVIIFIGQYYEICNTVQFDWLQLYEGIIC